MKCELKIKTEFVTPANAAVYMAHVNYRSLRPSLVEKYKRAMECGRWGLSILIFDEQGFLCDGQHRLRAVFDSQKGQYFAVITGWPRRDIVNMDNGKPRTKTDVIFGERGAKETNKLMALVVGAENVVATQSILNFEALDLYDKYGLLCMEVLDRSKAPVRAAVHLLAFVRGILRYPERKDEILEALSKMCDLDFSEPRMLGLKMYFQSNIASKSDSYSGGGRKRCYLKCARAVQAYLDGETLTKLYEPKTDPFEVGVR